MKNVFLHGYFCDNLGDDLFVEHICSLYPKTQFHIVVEGNFGLALSKIKNLKMHRLGFFNRVTDKLLNRWHFRESIAKKCDAFIHIGGSIFIQNTDWTAKFNNYSRLLSKTKERYIIGANFGPYSDDNFLTSYKKLFSTVNGICFRDRLSYNLFKDINHVNYAPDILFSYSFEKYISDKTEKTAVLSVMNKDSDYICKIAQLGNYLSDKGYKVILIGFCKAEGDGDALAKIAGLMEKPSESLYYSGNIDYVLKVLGSAEIIFATRFHAMILGWAMKKKVYPCIYSNKMLTVINDLCPEQKYCTVENINNLDFDKIIDDSNYPENIDEIKKSAFKHFETLGGAVHEL